MPGADGRGTCCGGAAGADSFRDGRFPGDNLCDGRRRRGEGGLRQLQELPGKPSQDSQQLGVLADQRDQAGEEDVGGNGEVFGQGAISFRFSL